MRSFFPWFSRSAVLGALVLGAGCQHEFKFTATTGAGGAGAVTGTGGSGATNVDGGSDAGITNGPPEIILPTDAGPTTPTACGDVTNYRPIDSPGYPVAQHMANAAAAQDILNNNMNHTDKAEQMRGVFGGQNGPQWSDIERGYDQTNLKIMGWEFRDGPRGVNYDQPIAVGDDRSNVGSVVSQYAPSTVFPTEVARGAMFDVDLERRIGEAMGDEALAGQQTMLLVPCVNILRHPFWGRAEETYGEDDYLLGRTGTGLVAGVQEYIAACVKHFAGNNIEDNRANLNSTMDDQTLREVYGRHFDMIINDGGVACVMAAYNAVNGTKSTNNTALLTTMLRTEFGYQGMVLSDWWAMPGGQVYNLDQQDKLTNATGALAAGLDMEVPWSLNYSVLDDGSFDTMLDTPVARVLEQKVRFNVEQLGVMPLGLKTPTSVFADNAGITNNDLHIATSGEAAAEGMVLLKNCPASNLACTAPTAASVLPIKRDGSIKSIAVVGATLNYCQTTVGGPGITNCSDDATNKGTIVFPTGVRIGDVGSSRVDFDRNKAVSPWQGISAAAGSGITVTSATTDGTDATGTDITAIMTAAQAADLTVVVVGLTPYDEGEEYNSSGDRTNLEFDGKDLGHNYGTLQNNIVNAVAANAALTGKPFVVVIEAGSAVNMPWLANAPAVVMAWYPGMVGGQALGQLLFGDQNFSGKLPITWPSDVSQLPPFNQGASTQMDYFLGYRRFDACTSITPLPPGCNAQIVGAPLYPFGYGLSYSSFTYSNLQIPCTTATDNSVIYATVDVTNTSPVAGSEVAMAFVSFPTGPNGTPRRSVKELKGFYRVALAAAGTVGDAKRITIPIRVQDLKYFDTTAPITTPGMTDTGTWKVQKGTYTIMVGPNAGNLPLFGTFVIN